MEAVPKLKRDTHYTYNTRKEDEGIIEVVCRSTTSIKGTIECEGLSLYIDKTFKETGVTYSLSENTEDIEDAKGLACQKAWHDTLIEIRQYLLVLYNERISHQVYAIKYSILNMAGNNHKEAVSILDYLNKQNHIKLEKLKEADDSIT